MTASWLPRARDVAAVVLGVLVAADALVVELGLHHVAFAWYSATLATVGAVSLWWRRKHPMRITVLGLLICVAGQIEWPVAVGLFTLTVRRRDRATWTLTGVAVLGVALEYCLVRDGFYPGASLTYSVPWIALFSFGGAFLGMRRDSIASLHERAERAEAEQEMRAEQARLNERTRIAREMHDVLAHRISLIALHAGALEVTEKPSPEAVVETAELIRETSRQALEDLRSVLGVLHSTGDPQAELVPQPRFADIADLVRASAEAGIPVTLTVGGPLHLESDVPEPVGRAAYRVVQESLTNIHKHARGAATEVLLEGGPGSRLDITVANVRPPDQNTAPLPGSGSGLVGLRERVAFVGGALLSGPTPSGGFRVQARLPWPAASAAATRKERERRPASTSGSRPGAELRRPAREATT